MADSADALSFDKQICFSLYSTANAMVRAYRPLLQSLDLTYLQYIVMMVLWEEEGLSVSTLGNKLHLDSGTLTPLLKRLEAKGLLLRKVSQKDERVKSLHLTELGRALKNKAANIPEKILCKTHVSYESLQQLKKQCDQLLSALNDDELKADESIPS
jgi:DNA-binding MarR family transcriptional regulator